MKLQALIDFCYIVASILFIIGLKMLSSQRLARKGNVLSAVGMLIAIVATLLYKGLSLQVDHRRRDHRDRHRFG